ncbi:MAG: peptidylprolyl isomerase [Burkholderiaceae bacterium]
MIYDSTRMKIDNGTLVSIDVSLHDAQGNLLEKSDKPLTYLHGHGDIFSRLEEELHGKAVGDQLALQLEPEESFGDYDPELVTLVSVDELGDGVTVDMKIDGSSIGAAPGVYTITDIAEGMAVLDANHPLAGLALRFTIEVVDVRAATAEEIELASTPTLPEFLHIAVPAGRTLH